MTVILAALFTIGNTAFAASTFTVSNPTGSTFRITRTGNTSVSETIDWRVVSLSAIAGVHFTGYNGNYSGTVTFNVNDTYKDVTISESTPGDNAYKYQNGTSRSYRFEVLDRNGDILASKDRSITTGTSVPSSGIFTQKTVIINSGETNATDDGYINNPYLSMAGTSYYDNAAPKTWLSTIGATLHMTLSMDVKEVNDGYQYIQLLFDNTSSCDDRTKCSDGNPGNINLSRYMAGFGHHPGSYDGNWSTYTFPVTSQGNNCGQVDNPWGNSISCKLYDQKFKLDSYRDSDGKLIIPTSFTTLVLRLNASGDNEDTWTSKNVKAYIQAADATAPTVLNNYKVSGGRHQKGNTIYVSVPFSEIVIVTGTPTLTSNWGTLSYTAGSGSNVLTFKGEISSDASGTFSVTGYSGTIKDLAGNALSGSISHSFGTTLDSDYTWSTSNFNSLNDGSYEIYTTLDLRHLALMVNSGNNNCSGLTFKQTHDITYSHTTNWDNSSSQEDNYIAIGTSSNKFQGTFDGQDHTISGIRIYRGGSKLADRYQGLFGYISGGTVRGVNLADARITGDDYVGGIAGHIFSSTVEDCSVAANVCIHAAQSSSSYHGGIVGHSQGLVRRCLSRALLSVATASDCPNCGAILGDNSSDHTVKDCIVIGATVPNVNNAGAIIGNNNDNSSYYVQRNYYRACTVAGVENATGVGVGYDKNTTSPHDVTTDQGALPLYSLTLPNGVTLDRTASATLPGTGNKTYTTGADIDGTPYAYATATLRLSYTGAAPAEGYKTAVYVNGDLAADNGDGTYTATMPAADATVTTAQVPIPWSGSGNSANDPYLIEYPSQLDLLATNVNAGNNYSGKFFALKNDITYSHNTNWNNSSSTENNYTAIGTNSNKFCGTFDGRNFTISGIRIYKGGDTAVTDDYLGLFGAIGSNGVVKGVNLADARITGHDYVGGLAGYSDSATVEDCNVAADVCIHALQYGSYHGGIAGYSTGTVQRCISRSTLTISVVSDRSFYGAIVGSFNPKDSKSMNNCLAVGATVATINYSGAIAGRSYASSQSLSNNYYRACTVAGTANATGVGIGPANISDSRHDVTANQGALALYSLTLPDGVTLVRSASATLPGTGNKTYTTGADIDGAPYAFEGASLTLSYSGDALATGYAYGLFINGTRATDNGNGTYTATMPAADATVTISTVAKDFTADGHSGDSEADAYIIYNKDQLDLLAKMVNGTGGYSANTFGGKYIKLANDITYTHTSDWNDANSTENNYTPIGTTVGGIIKPFYGNFDGCGHIISGIRIWSSSGKLGLFGRMREGGTVKNLTLTDARISSGNLRVGGIVGDSEGTVQNCHVTSTVAIFANNNNCNYYGGIVGYNDSTSAIIDCTSAATINNNGYSNCNRYGGIAGYNYGTVQNCLAVGVSVPSVNSYYGVIIGYNDRTITANYYRSSTVGDTANAVNVGVGSSEGAPADQAGARSVHALTLLAGVTASGESVVIDGTTYYAAGTTVTLSHGSAPAGYQEPFLGYSLNGADLGDNVNTFEMPAADATVTARWTVIDFTSGHNGTEADPYIIYNKDQLNLLAERVNSVLNYSSGKYFKLGADIEYYGTENNYTPIGTSSNKFRCTFDGDGHTISGINITGENDYQGLFGYIFKGTVKNVTMANSRISGKRMVGGIAGYIGTATISNCRVESTVTVAANSYLGSIVGTASDCTIDGCISAATVTNAGSSGNYCGGIVGFNSGTVKNCLVSGGSITITAVSSRGAIVGKNNSDGALSNNYYDNFSVNSSSSNIGCDSSDITDNDGAVQAVSSTTKPAEIGAQIASYSNGLTVYEHGAYYNGTYYLRHDLAGTAVGLTLTQGTKDGVSAYWGTYYNGTTNQTLVGATAYTMGSDFKLYRLGTDGCTIPKGVAVVIIATSADASLVPAGTGNLSITDHAPGGNQLYGSDNDVLVSDLSGTPHVLSISSGTIGFRQFSGASIPTGKAYYVVTP